MFGPAPGNLKASWSGTSMAAPMAASALALALAEPLAVPQNNLADALARHGFNLYSGGKNAAYLDLIGRSRLDVDAFLQATLAP